MEYLASEPAENSEPDIFGDLDESAPAPVATIAELGVSSKDIHEARLVRDAEEASPGIVAETLSAIVDKGEEPDWCRYPSLISKASSRSAWP